MTETKELKSEVETLLSKIERKFKQFRENQERLENAIKRESEKQNAH